MESIDILDQLCAIARSTAAALARADAIGETLVAAQLDHVLEAVNDRIAEHAPGRFDLLIDPVTPADRGW